MTTEGLVAELGAERYVSLGTWRRDGRVVDTPVWIVAVDGVLYCYSAADAGKIKRLRNSVRARIAACDLRGRVTGPWYDASAEVVDDPQQAARALDALRARYGWQMRVADFAAWLGRRLDRRAVIAIRPGGVPRGAVPRAAG